MNDNESQNEKNLTAERERERERILASVRGLAQDRADGRRSDGVVPVELPARYEDGETAEELKRKYPMGYPIYLCYVGGGIVQYRDLYNRLLYGDLQQHIEG